MSDREAKIAKARELLQKKKSKVGASSEGKVLAPPSLENSNVDASPSATASVVTSPRDSNENTDHVEVNIDASVTKSAILQETPLDSTVPEISEEPDDHPHIETSSAPRSRSLLEIQHAPTTFSEVVNVLSEGEPLNLSQNASEAFLERLVTEENIPEQSSLSRNASTDETILARCHELEEENNRLRETTEDYKNQLSSASEEKRSWEAKTELLQTQISEKDVSLEKLMTEIIQLQSDISEKNESIRKLKADVDHFSSSHQAHEVNITRLNQQIKSLEESNKNIISLSSQKSEDFARNILIYQDKANQYERLLEEQTGTSAAQISELQGLLLDSKSQNEILKKENQELTERNSYLESNMNALEEGNSKTKQKIDSLIAQVKENEAKLMRIQHDLNQKQRELDDATADYSRQLKQLEEASSKNTYERDSSVQQMTKSIAEFKNQILELSSKLQQSESNYQIVYEKLGYTTRLNESLQKALDALEAQNQPLQASLRDAEAEVVMKSREKDELARQLKQTELARDSQVEKMQELIDDLKRKMRNSEHENTSITGEMELLKTQLHNLSIDNARLIREKEHTESTLSRMQETHKVVQTELEQLQSQVEIRSKSTDELTIQIFNLEAQLKRKTADAENLLNSIEELRKTHTRQIESHSTTIQDLEAENEKLQLKVTEHYNALSIEKEKLAKSQMEKVQISASLTEVQDQLKRNEQDGFIMKNELNQSKQLNTELQSRIEIMAAAEIRLQSSIDDLLGKQASLEKILSEKTQRITYLGGLVEASTLLKPEIESRQMRIANLEADVKKKILETESLHDQIQSQKNENFQLGSRIALLSENIEDMDTNLSKLTLSHEQKEQEIAQLKQRLVTMDQVQRELADVSQKYSSQLTANEHLQKQVAAMESLSALPELITSLENRNQELQAQLEQGKLHIQELNVALGQEQVTAAELKASNKEALQKLAERESDFGEKCKLVESLEQRIEAMKQSQDAMEANHEAIVQEMSDDISSMRLKIEQSENELQEIMKSLSHVARDSGYTANDFDERADNRAALFNRKFEVLMQGFETRHTILVEENSTLKSALLLMIGAIESVLSEKLASHENVPKDIYSTSQTLVLKLNAKWEETIQSLSRLQNDCDTYSEQLKSVQRSLVSIQERDAHKQQIKSDSSAQTDATDDLPVSTSTHDDVEEAPRTAPKSRGLNLKAMENRPKDNSASMRQSYTTRKTTLVISTLQPLLSEPAESLPVKRDSFNKLMGLQQEIASLSEEIGNINPGVRIRCHSSMLKLEKSPYSSMTESHYHTEHSPTPTGASETAREERQHDNSDGGHMSEFFRKIGDILQIDISTKDYAEVQICDKIQSLVQTLNSYKHQIAVKDSDIARAQIENMQLAKNYADIEGRFKAHIAKNEAEVQSLHNSLLEAAKAESSMAHELSKFEAFITELFSLLQLQRSETIESDMKKIISEINKTARPSQKLGENATSNEKEVYRLRERIGNLIAQKNYLLGEISMYRYVEKSAVEFMSEVQLRKPTSQSSGNIKREKQHGYTQLRKYIFVIIASNRFLNSLRPQDPSHPKTNESGLLNAVQQKDTQIYALRERILELERSAFKEKNISQDFYSLQERFHRLTQLYKEQHVQVQRIPQLEEQLAKRKNLIDDLKKLLSESSRPVHELKEELRLLNERFQAALLAKQNAEAKEARERQSRQIAETELHMLKSRLSRSGSIPATPENHGTRREFNPRQIYSHTPPLRLVETYNGPSTSISTALSGDLVDRSRHYTVPLQQTGQSVSKHNGGNE